MRAAGAFIKLIEIPAARGIAKGLMIPARKFMDGASGEENVLSSIAVRVPNEQPCVPFETARPAAAQRLRASARCRS